MNQTKVKLTTRAVVTAYVEYRLLKVFGKDFECQDSFLGETYGEHPVVETTRKIVARNLRFEQVKDLSEVYRMKVKIIQKGVSNEIARDTYICNITSSFFAGRGPLANPTYSWHRVAMSIEMTSQLAEEAVRLEHTNRVRDLIEWCLLVFQEWSVNLWIRRQGGWEQMLETGLAKRCKESEEIWLPCAADEPVECERANKQQSPATSKSTSPFIDGPQDINFPIPCQRSEASVSAYQQKCGSPVPCPTYTCKLASAKAKSNDCAALIQKEIQYQQQSMKSPPPFYGISCAQQPPAFLQNPATAKTCDQPSRTNACKKPPFSTPNESKCSAVCGSSTGKQETKSAISNCCSYKPTNDADCYGGTKGKEVPHWEIKDTFGWPYVNECVNQSNSNAAEFKRCNNERRGDCGRNDLSTEDEEWAEQEDGDTSSSHPQGNLKFYDWDKGYPSCDTQAAASTSQGSSCAKPEVFSRAQWDNFTDYNVGKFA